MHYVVQVPGGYVPGPGYPGDVAPLGWAKVYETRQVADHAAYAYDGKVREVALSVIS